MFIRNESCRKTDFTVSNLNNNTIAVIGHGGMGIAHNYPMNSFPSLMRAINLGADGVEIDVQMTADGVLVAYHDYELSERSAGVGQIYDLDWEELEGTTYLNPLYTDYAVLRVDSILSAIPDLEDVVLFLDCKNFDPDTSEYYLGKFTDVLIGLVDEYGLGENVFIELKRTDIISALQEKRNDLKIFYYGSDFYTAIKKAVRYGLPVITLSIDRITSDQVRMAHSYGVMVSLVNVHTRSRNREAIKMNADFIQTDRLAYLIRLLKGSPFSNF